MMEEKELERWLEGVRKWGISKVAGLQFCIIASRMVEEKMDATPVLAEALRITQEIEWCRGRAEVLARIARGYVEMGLFEDALEIANRIEFPSEDKELAPLRSALQMGILERKADALFEIARASAEALKLQKARDGELQKPDFKKPSPGQPSAEKAKEKR